MAAMLMSEDERDLRLFDLERIGPFLHWPPGRTPLSDYRTSASDCLSYAREKALEARVHEVFEAQLAVLNMLDFSGPRG